MSHDEGNALILQLQVNESTPFIDEILCNLTSTICDLTQPQVCCYLCLSEASNVVLGARVLRGSGTDNRMREYARDARGAAQSYREADGYAEQCVG